MTTSVSVVVSTNGRRAGLASLFQGLLRQTYSPFEVVVVCGPSDDGTHELVADWESRNFVKARSCQALNIAQSRNVGIAEAAGSLVAFIDDDAIPEPQWLEQLTQPFAEEQVVGAGGAVFGPTGLSYEFRFSACDRLGKTTHDLSRAFCDGNFPLSPLFPHFMGTNCMFRRAALVGIGGFDEEYEYFLDETDVCCRLVDLGFELRQLDGAPVHHKFSPSHLRNSSGISLSKYPIIKNQIYFSLVNNKGHHSTSQIISNSSEYIVRHRRDLESHVRAGEIAPPVVEEFARDVDRAWEVGLTRGFSGERRVQPAEYFCAPPTFKPFSTVVSAETRRTLAFITSQHALPKGAQPTLTFAQQLAQRGHVVHVIVCGSEHDSVELVDAVWVRRRVARYHALTESALRLGVPEPLWHAAATVSAELDRIDAHSTLDFVEDASLEGLAIAAQLAARRNLLVHVAPKGLRAPPGLTTSLSGAPLSEAMTQIERFSVSKAKGLLAVAQDDFEAVKTRLGIVALGPTRLITPDPRGYVLELMSFLGQS